MSGFPKDNEGREFISGIMKLTAEEQREADEWWAGVIASQLRDQDRDYAPYDDYKSYEHAKGRR